MSNDTTWWRSTKVIGAALAVLVVFQGFLIVNNVQNVVRYVVGGLIAVALVVGVVQLSTNRRRR